MADKIVFQLEGTAVTDYYDGALFTVDNYALIIPSGQIGSSQKTWQNQSRHFAWDILLADVMNIADTNGKRIRITVEVLED